jgi:hypothetical protein
MTRRPGMKTTNLSSIRAAICSRKASFTSPDEATRLTASVSQPLHRYHYRDTAADLAARAADQLPARSQAFAAVLCEGTRYVLNSAPEHAQQLYRRYLNEGAYVPWGASFGQSCPAPDFAKVAREQRAAQIATAKRIGLYSCCPFC